MKHPKHRNSGFSHHLLFPLLAAVVAGFIGVATLNLSSAATNSGPCVKKSFSEGSKDTCVKYIQTIVGVTPDKIYGPKTKTAVKKVTGTKSVKANSAAWDAICAAGKAAGSGAKYTAYVKACVTVAYKTRACTYTTPSIKTVPPKKLQCPYKVFTTEKAAKKQQTANYKLAEKYKKDYGVYLKAIKWDKSSDRYKKLLAEFEKRYVGAKRVSGIIQKIDAKTGAAI